MIKTRLIPTLQMLSDQEHQEKVWLSENAPGYDSYPEALEVFYETWDLFKGEHAKGQLTPMESHMLDELHFMIKKFDQTADEEDMVKLLSDPKWGSIRQKAQDLLKLLMERR